jgi:ubiquitin C-terminal hydrolase
MFNGTMHQDAHELLNVVLNNMIDTLHRHPAEENSVAADISFKDQSTRDESEDKSKLVFIEYLTHHGFS